MWVTSIVVNKILFKVLKYSCACQCLSVFEIQAMKDRGRDTNKKMIKILKGQIT